MLSRCRAVIRLHSSAAYPTTRSPIFTPSYSASQRCLVAVDNILSLARFVVDSGMLDKLGPPFAFTLWVSARLLLVHGSTIAHSVSPDIHFFVDALARMGKYWKVAERYSTILQRVLDEYNEYVEQSAATNGGERDQRMTPSSVKILADMRRCAFDLDFLISRQPRMSSSSSSSSSRNAAAAAAARVTSASAPPPQVRLNPAPNELEYLDVFGFFNVPRVPTAPVDDATTNTNTSGINDVVSGSGNPMSINGLTTTNASANEFNITNYLIPTPETDWLFRPAG